MRTSAPAHISKQKALHSLSDSKGPSQGHKWRAHGFRVSCLPLPHLQGMVLVPNPQDLSANPKVRKPSASETAHGGHQTGPHFFQGPCCGCRWALAWLSPMPENAVTAPLVARETNTAHLGLEHRPAAMGTLSPPLRRLTRGPWLHSIPPKGKARGPLPTQTALVAAKLVPARGSPPAH